MMSITEELLQARAYIKLLNERVNDYRKENQSLSGRIKILEEQHDIMHNFLVEINKYLVKISAEKIMNKHGEAIKNLADR